MRILVVSMVAVALLAGCAARHCRERMACRPAPISHIVLVKLKDPAERGALLADCNARLTRIATVVSYAGGHHLETGRDNVESGYDVGLYVGFKDEAGYKTYIDHPEHRTILDTWMPKCEWLRIYDVLDTTP